MAGKVPYYPRKPFPIGVALLAILLFAIGFVVTADIASRTFAKQLGTSAPAILGPGVTAGSTWIDPRRAMPLIARYDWACNGIQWNKQSATHLIVPVTPGQPGAKPFARCSAAETAALTQLNWIFAVGFGTSFAVAFVLVMMGSASRDSGARRASRRIPPMPPKVDPEVPPERRPFVLHVGKSTGILLDLGHGAGITPNRDVCLVDDDASQNVVLFGGIGSGKTNAINRFVLQALRQACGMLVFDVKGDYGDTLKQLAAMVNRPVVTIGVGGRPLNLLAGLTPEVAAGFLKSVFILAGGGNTGGVVYTDTATNYARNVLGMLSFFPARYSLRGLYDAVFDAPSRKSLAIATKAKLAELRDSDRLAFNRLTSYFQYVSETFPSFDMRIKKGAETSLSQILDAFQLDEVDRAFCQGGDNAIEMTEVLDGTIFLLDLPISVYGLSAKTVYTLVKLRFFNTVQRRRREPTWNQTRRLVFVCDEAQEVVAVAKDALSDLSFWDKSRSAGAIGVYSAQSFESFRAVIGDASLTGALLQNFRQQIIFRTEDPETIKRVSYLLGKVSVLHRSSTTSTMNSTLTNSRGQSEQSSVRDEDLINGQFFRTLPRGRALALLSIGGAAYDDVVTMDYQPTGPLPAANGRRPQAVR